MLDEIERIRGVLGPLNGPLEAAAPRRAAVLLLLYPRNRQLHFLLIQRPETMSNHPGQIALPGGASELDDETLWHTALRESWEELGIPPQDVEGLGSLPPIMVTVSNFLVHPFVGWMPSPPEIHADNREVSAVIEARLEDLLLPESRDEEEWNFRGGQYRIALYRLSGHTVWGATARILSELQERLAPASPELPRPGSVRPV